MKEQLQQSFATPYQVGSLALNRGLIELVSIDPQSDRIPVVTPAKLITFGRQQKGKGMGNRAGTIWRILDKALAPANPRSPVHLAEDEAQQVGKFEPRFPGSLRWLYADQFGRIVELIDKNREALESGIHGFTDSDVQLLEAFRDELYLANQSER